ncbi:MAG: hypothetical protein ACWGSQ_15320 [Longimicrobiales bacterium]
MKITFRPARAVGLLAVLAMAAACSDLPMSPPADDSLNPLATLLSEGICQYDAWDETVAYARGDRTSHGNHDWRAKKPSQGIAPGSHPAYWGDLGACAADPGDPGGGDPTDPTPIQIFGVWHAGDDYAEWGTVRDMIEFDLANYWIIDRGDGSGLPSVNLVVLSFVNPLDLLLMSTPEDPLAGIPVGMTQEVVDYFRDAGIRVMLSIGGVTYTEDWNLALALDPWELGLNAAAVASELGVGIEIDYEQNTDPDLVGLQAFVDAYRSVHDYDASGLDPGARLTIDLAAGGRYLQALNRYATEHWLDNADPVLDYANAMVTRSSGTPDQWQEHVDGKLHYDPPILPKAPNRFTGGLYLKGDRANCNDFNASEQAEYADYVQTVLPNGAGDTPGMLGFMFWAAEAPSARKNYTPTTPPNTCEGGMGVAATVFEIEIPMPPLRQN